MKLNLTLKPKMINTAIKTTNGNLPIKVESTINNIPGPSFETYTHTQMVASTSWEIEHNLNCYPSVSIVDTGGTVVVGEVQYVSDKKIVVTFSSAFSGKAYVN